jgi:ABC-type transport system substrate-binding protein
MDAMKKTVITVLALFILIGVVNAQDAEGRGVIREGSAAVDSVTTLNPILCADATCGRIVSLLFPSVIGVDLDARTFAPGGFGGLADGWVFDLETFDAEQPTLTVTLGDDHVWSDGLPITAYDVYFTHLALTTGGMVSAAASAFNQAFSAVTLLDETTLVYTLRDRNCDVLAALDTYILPAHVYDTNFRDRVEGLGDNLADRFVREALWNTVTGGRATESFLFNHPSNRQPVVTASPVGLRFDAHNTNDSIRLLHENEMLAYELADVTSPDQSVNRFLNGDLNVLFNPPFPRRDDLRAAAARGDVRLFESTGNTWYTVAFNLADARNPRSAFDDDGQPVDQGQHFAFGDIRVRQAFQLALDVPAIIDSVLNGNGTRVPANQTPTSWAYNADLLPISHDPAQAARLLTEAGWVDANGDGVRECTGCLYAPEGTSLQISLFYPDSAQAGQIVSLMSQQLSRVGLSLNGQFSESTVLREQFFDAALVQTVENYPVEPDQFDQLSAGGDVIGLGENITSYNDPDVANLLYQARTVPDCDIQVRADLYRQAQTRIQADSVYAPLFVVDQLLAARSSLENFDPRPQNLFWNIADWVVTAR